MKNNACIGVLAVALFISVAPSTTFAGGGDGGDGGGGGFFGGLGNAADAAVDAVGDAMGAAADAVGDAFGGAFGGDSDSEGSSGPGIGDNSSGPGNQDGSAGGQNGPGDIGVSADTGIGVDTGDVGSAGGAGGDFSNAGRAVFTPPQPDLIAVAVSAVSNGRGIDFRGEVRNEGTGSAIVPSTAKAEIASTLLLDLECNGETDSEKDFTNPFRFLTAKSPTGINLFTTDTPPKGEHCFSMETDTNNLFAESDEKNNKSGWFTFEVTEDFDSFEDPSSNNDDDNDSNDSDANPDSNSIILEVRPLTGAGVFTNTQGQTFEAAGPYQATDLSLTAEQHVALRWSAPGFTSCFASFADIKERTSGDTELNNHTNANIDVIEPGSGQSTDYSIRCIDGSEEQEVSITVTKQ